MSNPFPHLKHPTPKHTKKSLSVSELLKLINSARDHLTSDGGSVNLYNILEKDLGELEILNLDSFITVDPGIVLAGSFICPLSLFFDENAARRLEDDPSISSGVMKLTYHAPVVLLEDWAYDTSKISKYTHHFLENNPLDLDLHKFDEIYNMCNLLGVDKKKVYVIINNDGIINEKFDYTNQAFIWMIGSVVFPKPDGQR